MSTASELRRLLVVQGDTEPASVEQQRQLCNSAPSLYDLRNLFQVNVEEGRHLWAMVYLLHRYFGRDGRDEADELLERHSGDSDRPRILGAFNEETPDWLSFFFFTYFTDRDGKFQLASLRESGFDPLARTCDFMLKEEAHHMFVARQRCGPRCATLRRADEAARHRGHSAFGGVDVPTLQRYLNFHYSVSLDLFGAETSTNAANYYAAGLKGRFQEERHHDDHRLLDATRLVPDDRGRQRRKPTSTFIGRLERDASRRLHRRLPEGNRTVESVTGRSRSQPSPSPPGVQPVSGRFCRAPNLPRRLGPHGVGMGCGLSILASKPIGQGVCAYRSCSRSMNRGAWRHGSRLRPPVSTNNPSSSRT